MKKFLAFLFILFGLASMANAQVSAVTVTSPSSYCAAAGSSVTVVFNVTSAADFNPISYDILFSASTTATSSAYSSYLGGPMVCSNTDAGYFFYNTGQTTNTITKVVPVPAASYSGNIIVIAQENVVYLSCSVPSGFKAFTNPCSPTPTSTSTNTRTNTPTFTFTPTNTATNTFTPTATFTNTFTCNATLTPACANQFTNTPTNTFTNTFTFTPTNTSTPTPTRTPTNTRTSTPTFTPTNTATNVNTLSPTPTPTYSFYPLVNPVTGAPDVWFDAAPSLTPTPGTGRVDDARLINLMTSFIPYPWRTNVTTTSFSQAVSGTGAVTLAAPVSLFYNDLDLRLFNPSSSPITISLSEGATVRDTIPLPPTGGTYTHFYKGVQLNVPWTVTNAAAVTFWNVGANGFQRQ